MSIRYSYKLRNEEEYLKEFPIGSKHYNPITHGVIKKMQVEKSVESKETERDKRLKQFKT